MESWNQKVFRSSRLELPKCPVSSTGHLPIEGVEIKKNMTGKIRIDRQQKNAMRSQLEEILAIHRSLDKKIDSYQKESTHSEYNRFWNEMKQQNSENIKNISKFMVLKCNR